MQDKLWWILAVDLIRCAELVSAQHVLHLCKGLPRVGEAKAKDLGHLNRRQRTTATTHFHRLADGRATSCPNYSCIVFHHVKLGSSKPTHLEGPLLEDDLVKFFGEANVCGVAVEVRHDEPRRIFALPLGDLCRHAGKQR